jgi:hypothetical protein
MVVKSIVKYHVSIALSQVVLECLQSPYRKIDYDKARPAGRGDLFKALGNDNISNLFSVKTAQH